MNQTIISNNIAYIGFELRYIILASIKLGLSIVLSFIISIERELHSHPGGACTHILVGLGSCLFTMISINLRNQVNAEIADPARICAQIVSGMGFLGSATIFKSNNYVKGINTAANLWISAAISMSIGADLWELGIVTAFYTLLILLINNRYKKYRYGIIKKNDEIKNFNNIDLEAGDNSSDSNYSINSINSHSDSSPTNIRMSVIQNNNLSRNPEDAPYGDESEFKDD
jgi:uncharacterized membrane protein YhiD involved in acid resistance